MNIIKILSYIIGILYLFGGVFEVPVFYNNPKSKILVRRMGKKNFTLMLLGIGLALLVIGYLL